ncbi:MAG: hypothetical protein PHS14_13680 [Elusimicrobia bacterium]|nr:hypothetical protein [Elusimicrobiota bacterium]
MILESKTIAWCAVAGIGCDAIGGVYLTYELLGGRSGPLGLGVRAATYGLIFGLGYGLVFGPFFGVVAGFGLGGILGLEFWRVAVHQRKYGSSPLYHIPFFGVARGLLLGLACLHRFGGEFALVFAVLNAVFLAIVYRLRYAPTYDYEAVAGAAFSLRAWKSGVVRALAVGLAGGLTGWYETRSFDSIGFGLTIGLVVGLVSLAIGAVSPRVEWWIEHLPERKLAVIGFGMIGLGLMLQSVQYLVVILGPR